MIDNYERNELVDWPIVNYSLSIVNYKDMEVPINDFDDIRPLNNDEVKDAIESLIANEDFERAFRYIKPDVDWKEFSETMRSFKTKEDFKAKLAYEAVMWWQIKLPSH